MLRSTLHTIVTHRFAVGLSAVALLGGGAALASPAGPFGSLTDDVVPLQTVPPEIPATPDVVLTEDVEEEEMPELETLEEPGEEEVVEDAPEVQEGAEEDDGLEEDDGPGWALGSDHADLAGFCEARIAEAAEAEVAEAEAELREDGAEPVGVPPFCDVDGEQVAPNAHGRSVSDQARNAERPAAGPPSWANSNRPSDVPQGPPSDVPRGDDDDADEESEDDPDATVAPAGGDVEPGGPPEHANARANRN